MNEIILVRGIWGAGIPDSFGVVISPPDQDGRVIIRWMTPCTSGRYKVKYPIPPHTNIGVWEIRQGDHYYEMALNMLINGYDSEENLDDSPVYHGKPLTDVLAELKRRGLAYSDVVKLYGVPRDENPYAAFIQKHLANDNDMELDDKVILSESETGCWVSCWCYVEDEAVGIDRHAMTLVVDLDERGIFKAHVEDHMGSSIFEFSNEDENGNPSEDGLWLVTAGYMRHNHDTHGLLGYLREVGLANSKNHFVDVG